jgi:hypothetical protein
MSKNKYSVTAQGKLINPGLDNKDLDGQTILLYDDIIADTMEEAEATFKKLFGSTHEIIRVYSVHLITNDKKLAKVA